MAEPDYRAMLIALCEAVEEHFCEEYGKMYLPSEVEEWWESDPVRLHEEAVARRRAEVARAESEVLRAREIARAAEEEAEAWRSVRADPAEFIAQNVAGAEAKAAQAAARLAHFEAGLAIVRKTAADEASATAPAQPVDPAGLGSRIEAPTPHPIPHESPKEG